MQEYIKENEEKVLSKIDTSSSQMRLGQSISKAVVRHFNKYSFWVWEVDENLKLSLYLIRTAYQMVRFRNLLPPQLSDVRWGGRPFLKLFPQLTIQRSHPGFRAEVWTFLSSCLFLSWHNWFCHSEVQHYESFLGGNVWKYAPFLGTAKYTFDFWRDWTTHCSNLFCLSITWFLCLCIEFMAKARSRLA